MKTPKRNNVISNNHILPSRDWFLRLHTDYYLPKDFRGTSCFRADKVGWTGAGTEGVAEGIGARRRKFSCSVRENFLHGADKGGVRGVDDL